ncbi:hypothetical protein J6590_082405 [Homalodisca vitripennis]|nr:hypothetical protein J6590_082405 [Homalodisca vitripennis]
MNSTDYRVRRPFHNFQVLLQTLVGSTRIMCCFRHRLEPPAPGSIADVGWIHPHHVLLQTSVRATSSRHRLEPPAPDPVADVGWIHPHHTRLQTSVRATSSRFYCRRGLDPPASYAVADIG